MVNPETEKDQDTTPIDEDPLLTTIRSLNVHDRLRDDEGRFSFAKTANAAVSCNVTIEQPIVNHTSCRICHPCVWPQDCRKHSTRQHSESLWNYQFTGDVLER